MSARLQGRTMVAARPDARQGAADRPWLWINLSLAGAVLLSAFAVIHSTHACRELYTRLQELEARQWNLQEDYGRLLLEESTWASHYRVERVARTELRMIEPDLSLYRVVEP